MLMSLAIFVRVMQSRTEVAASRRRAEKQRLHAVDARTARDVERRDPNIESQGEHEAGSSSFHEDHASTAILATTQVSKVSNFMRNPFTAGTRPICSFGPQEARGEKERTGL